MKENTAIIFNDILRKTKLKIVFVDFPNGYKYSIFITISIIAFSFFAWKIREGAFIRKGRLIERGVYLTNQLSYGGV